MEFHDVGIKGSDANSGLLQGIEGQGQLILGVGMLLTPQDDELRREPYVEDLQALDNGMASGAKRNHQRWLRDAGDAVMDDDPIAVFLSGTVEAALAGPFIAAQNGFAMPAEIFLIVMLASETARTHSSRCDLQRATGADEDGLKALAARCVCEMCERCAHGLILSIPGVIRKLHVLVWCVARFGSGGVI
jgi:hypothetical protein